MAQNIRKYLSINSSDCKTFDINFIYTTQTKEYSTNLTYASIEWHRSMANVPKRYDLKNYQTLPCERHLDLYRIVHHYFIYQKVSSNVDINPNVSITTEGAS